MNIPPVTDALLEVDGRVALLTLNRDDVRNALTGTQLIEDIVGVAEWVNRCDDVSVLVITGAGAAFSAGGNVKDMAGRSGDFAGDVAEVAQRYRRGIQRIPLALCEVEVPVIAAVNGAAIGAGFDLANMADIRLASRRARFGETFLNLGIIPRGWRRLVHAAADWLPAGLRADADRTHRQRRRGQGAGDCPRRRRARAFIADGA
jgi:Enoyl-CoA hydratase/carnithine racemase